MKKTNYRALGNFAHNINHLSTVQYIRILRTLYETIRRVEYEGHSESNETELISLAF